MKISFRLVWYGIALIFFCALQASGREWQIAFKVVDDAGAPVTNARVWVVHGSGKPNASFDPDPFKPNDWARAGYTDAKGVFVASHDDKAFQVKAYVEKSGFYSFERLYVFGFASDSTYAGTHLTQSVTLRRVGTPIAMYAKRESAKIPKLGEPFGFDLMLGDWVAPNGEGVHADLYLCAERTIVSNADYNARLTISFPNNGDGIQVAQPLDVTGGEFKSSRTALPNGYASQLVLNFSRKIKPDPVFGYIFRVQTKLGPDGAVTSALYGKIFRDIRFYGGLNQSGCGVGFDYYLNPTPNDFNLEYKRGANLIKGLEPSADAKEP